MRNKIKIGFSDIGGIYIGKNTQTKYHKYHAITIAVSFSGKFDIICEHRNVSCSGIIVQPNTIRKFTTPIETKVAFIHIEPFCIQGLKLLDKTKYYKTLAPHQVKYILNLLKEWFSSSNNSEIVTQELINNISTKFKTELEPVKLDKRIVKSINIIRKTENITLTQIAAVNSLSKYRLSHLFKQQVGISFKEYLVYTKLIRSLKAIFYNQNLTESSYTGGFADQAHFTRTYLKSFGILPSKSIK